MEFSNEAPSQDVGVSCFMSSGLDSPGSCQVASAWAVAEDGRRMRSGHHEVKPFSTVCQTKRGSSTD